MPTYSNYTLRLPSADYEATYSAYISELGNEERYPFVMDFEHQPFDQLIQRLDNLARGIDVPDGAVVNHTYWLLDNNELIGVGNVRPDLNQHIAHIGGHIGFGIRPSYRQRGVGLYLLQQLIVKAAEHGVREVKLHCHASNAGSRTVIERAGGILESRVVDANDESISRYVVRRLNGST